MIRLIFSEEMRERLRHERIHHPHPRVRQRIEALYLKSEGWAHQAICASLGISKPTLVSYLRAYQEGGFAALTACRFRRAQSALAPYADRISIAFAHSPPRTLVEASTRIAELTGIERSPAQVGKVLKKFGLRRRKTGAIPGPALTTERLEEQTDFETQELTPRLKEAQAGQRAVFFGRRPLRPRPLPELGVECGPLLATYPQRSAAVECFGRLERHHASTDHRHHGYVHQPPTCGPDAVQTRRTGLERTDHGRAG